MVCADPNFLLKALLSQTLEDLRYRDRVWALCEVVQADDLISFSKALGPGFYPLQVSPGRLFATVATVEFGSMAIVYEMVNQDVICHEPVGRPESPAAVMFRTSNGTGITVTDGCSVLRHEAAKESISVVFTGATEKPDNGFATNDVSDPIPENLIWAATDVVLSEIVFAAGQRDMVLGTKPLIIILNAFLQKLNGLRPESKSRVASPIYQILTATEGMSCPRIETFAADLGMSRRNLQYCTTRKLGVPPKRLMKLQGLRNAMRFVCEGAQQGSHIGDIAYECGFEHFPQFCSDYRRLFGERASDTLQRYLGRPI